MLTFGQGVTSALTRYATFSGRARRSEYWWFHLFGFGVYSAASMVDLVLRLALDLGLDVVTPLVWLALLLPTLAVTVRRLHDTGRRGWWMWLPLPPLLITVGLAFAALFAFLLSYFDDSVDLTSAVVPTLVAMAVFGLAALGTSVWLLLMLCQDSTPGPNRYGPSPKQPWSPPVAPGYHPPVGYGPPPAT